MPRFGCAPIARGKLLWLAATLLTTCVATRSAAEAPTFVLQWGGPGAGTGKFVSPKAVAIDLDGRVLVPDDSGRLQRFDAEGKLLDEWGGTDEFERLFTAPAAAASAPSGNVYVAAGIMIREYDGNGETAGRWGAPQPRGIAVGPTGNVYVTDGQNHRILVFDADRTLLTRLGKAGSGVGEFADPAGIAIDSKGNIYVVDSGNARIQKLDRDGKPLAAWGTSGSGPGQFDSPQGICLDRKGRLYVVDQGNNRVQQFDDDGKLLAQWGTQGAAPGQFEGPTGIACDRQGNLYVADTGNHRIQKFRAK